MAGTASNSFLFEDNFETTAPVNNNATYRYGRSIHCTHEMREDAFDLHGSAHGRGFRIVAGAGHQEGCHGTGSCEIRNQDYLANNTNLLGFSSYYADTLGADSSEVWHNIGQGAFVGVEKLPTGEQAFALRAESVKGLVVVCSKPVVLSADSVEASARIYVAQGGWDGPDDELRVWADLGDSQPSGGISLLPNCTSLATPENIDLMHLRSTSNFSANSTGPPLSSVKVCTPGRLGCVDPEWQRGNRWRDDAWALVKARLAQDTWAWKHLSVSLGRLQDAEVRVCVGLQSGGRGNTAVFVDRLRLSSALSGMPGSQPCSSQLSSPECQPGCAPSAQLVSISSLSSLSSSCGIALSPLAFAVLSVLLGGIALVAVGKFVRMLCDLRTQARERRFSGLDATAPTPLAPVMNAARSTESACPKISSAL